MQLPPEIFTLVHEKGAFTMTVNYKIIEALMG